MTWLFLGIATLALGDLFGLARGRVAFAASVFAIVLGTAALATLATTVAAHVVVVGAIGLATVLARPPAWRPPEELVALVQTTLLAELAFCAWDPTLVALLWLLSMVPALRRRQEGAVSRRPDVLRLALSAAPVVAGLVAHLGFPGPTADAVLYVGCVVGSAVRMGVAPASPFLLADYDRLRLGRAALAAAARPSVALLLAVRAAVPEQVEVHAGWLQGWAAVAAILVAFQGLAATTPRRQLGCMAATQSALILYGLVAVGEMGVYGALVQWAGLGISLIGLGLVVEAIESRVGRRRAGRVHGLLSRAPGMAAVFLLFAATMAGFPGTTGFIGEDMVLQASAAPASLLRTLLLVATALNGVTMAKMFAHSFLGKLGPREALAFPPTVARERLAFGGLCTMLAALVAWPSLIGL